MAKYQVALIERPAGWNPSVPDDVPAQIQGGYEVVGEASEVFAAVRQAVELNQKADTAGRWAIVIDAESPGLTWKTARICTPIRYKIAAIWRSDGWEPTSPYDVPNCPWRAKGRSDDEAMSFVKAADTVVALNRQSMDCDGTAWYVVVAVENEPVSQSFAFDRKGTETTVSVRRLHPIQLEQGGHGDCHHCPAHVFRCSECECELPAVESIAETYLRNAWR